MLKLHLGSGRRHIPGFVHVDLGDWPHLDHRHDIRSLPMFHDESVDLIYCCHTFEYFDQEERIAALKEWRRVLSPGGLLRLAVPDFEALIAVYRETGQLERILGPLYGRIDISGPDGTKLWLFHKTTYDFNTLQRVLEQGGFTDVRRYDWRQTEHKDHDDFSQAYVPHMDKEHGRLISLNVEANKISAART